MKARLSCIILLNRGKVKHWQIAAVTNAISANAIEVIGLIPTEFNDRCGFSFKSESEKPSMVNESDLSYKKFSLDNTAEIKSAGADFIFSFSHLFHSELNQLCKYGVWYFSFVNGDKIISEEYFIKVRSTTATLCLIGDKKILQQGRFRIYQYDYKRSFNQIFKEASKWIVTACKKNKANNNVNTISGSVLQTHKISFYDLLKFNIRLGANKIIHWFKLLFTKEVWSVGVITKPVHKCFLKGFTDSIYWLKEPDNGFNADPFGFIEDNNLCILYERLNFNANHGKIFKTVFDGNKFTKPAIFLEDKKHLSYPFVFNNKDEILVIPEHCASGSLKSYSINNQTAINTKPEIIIEKPVVDATIIYCQNRYWMFCTLKNDLPDVKLYVFHSENLRGNWISHSQNPVKIDVCSARPGGNIFEWNGKWYRPSQNSSTGYGTQIIINEIVDLTENNFEEKEVAVLSPDKFSKYDKGLHTLSFAGMYSLIDGKRIKFSFNKNIFKMVFGKNQNVS